MGRRRRPQRYADLSTPRDGDIVEVWRILTMKYVFLQRANLEQKKHAIQKDLKRQKRVA